MDAVEELTSAMAADLENPAVSEAVKGTLYLDPTGGMLKELALLDVNTPANLRPVVFRQTRKLLVRHQAVPGLGQLTWEGVALVGLNKVISTGIDIGAKYLEADIAKELADKTFRQQRLIEQERTKRAELAVEAARLQAAGEIATAQVAAAREEKALPGWVVPAGIVAAVAL